MTKSKYHDQYLQEDEHILFHQGDPDLDVIKIKLPKLEDWYSEQLKREVTRDEALTFVDGYGLAPKDQFFTKQVIPQKIKIISETVFKKKSQSQPAKFKHITDVKLEHLYEELEYNQKHYESEIQWIKREIKRRYVGYWCFINGKPTYLNGANYFFLNYWKIKNFGKNDNLPDYRDYQRIMFHILMYGYTTTDMYFKTRVVYRENGLVKEHFTNLDLKEIDEKFKDNDYFVEKDKGFIIPTEDGKRTCHGINFVSARRVAKTAITCCFGTWVTLNVPEQTFIIQAMNEDQAIDKIFVKQIQTPILKLPFFFRPFNRGKLESKNGLDFQYEGTMASLARAGVVPEQMDCFITPLSSNEKAADGEAEIAFVYRDEPAKKADASAKDQNIPHWWYNTMKPAIERGDNIRGYCVMPSTVGDMDTGGGSQFLNLANDSHFCRRNENGVTNSGLLNFFLAGYYAVEGFIDIYGNSIIEDPKEPVLTNEGKYKSIGAKTWVQNKADSFERLGQWDKLTKHQQNFPSSWREAFAPTPKDSGLPMNKMRNRIKDLKFLRTPITTRINFKWAGGVFGGDVIVENDPNGDWVMSYLPPLWARNRRTIVSPEEGYIKPKKGNKIYAPDASVGNKFFLCCDPVKFHKYNTSGGKKSKASASMFYKQDSMVDSVDGNWKPREEWVSNDWTMYYLKDVEDKNLYHEEWLKACIFHGAYLYPEWPDAEGIVEYFREHGFDGYLLRDMGSDGKVERRPGVWASADTINEMIGDVMTFFTNNCNYIKIHQIIEEWTQFRGPEDLTNRDLCASSGWCLRAIRSRVPEIYQDMNETIEVEGDFDVYDVD